MIFDVAIIGGGLPGCSAALHLRQRHASVVLLERGRCGSQASGVNYGGVRQQGRHEAELPLARRSRQIWARLRELVGDNCEFMVTGHLKLARSDEQAHELERYATMARMHGLVLDLLNRGQLQNRYPYLDGEAIAGSLCAEDGQANRRLVAPAFARAARAMGAEIREHTEVEGATRSGTTFHIACRDGTAVAARCIINVAGALGSSVAAWFGESAPEEVMAPNMCVTEPLPYFLQPNLGVCGGDIYIRQIPRGNVIFGGGSGVADKVAIKARPLAAVAYETVTDESGGLPLLAPMSEVAGRLAIEATAFSLRKSAGSIGKLLGGVPGVRPAKVAIIGGGVVGTQAARVAVGLGADVVVLDRALRRLRELDELFQSRARTRYSTLDAIEEEIVDADVVIGAVLVPGASAPRPIMESQLKMLRRGCVLVDVAIDQGGCFEASRPTTHRDPIYVVDDVIHYCVANMPGAVPLTASHALSNATLPYGLALADKGLKAFHDRNMRNGLNIFAGRITHKAVAESLNAEFFDAFDFAA